MSDPHDPKDPGLIARMAADLKLQKLSHELTVEAVRYRYSYNFSWLGRPIIQYPQDVMALQEIIWSIKPEAIIETGVAHGGSLVFYASILELIKQDGIAIGVDVDIREHNRVEIENHPLSSRIRMVVGNSIDPSTVERVRECLMGRKKVMVVLDSNHTSEHVLEELRMYSQFVSQGSYLIVLDTIIERLPDDTIGDRPWRRGDSPMTAVKLYLEEVDRFEIDSEYDQKLLISAAPSGYLRCVKA